MARAPSTKYELETGELVTLPLSTLRALRLMIFEGVTKHRAAQIVGVTTANLTRYLVTDNVKRVMADMCKSQREVDYYRAKARMGALVDSEDSKIALAAAKDVVDRLEGKAITRIEQNVNKTETVRFVIHATTPEISAAADDYVMDEYGKWVPRQKAVAVDPQNP